MKFTKQTLMAGLATISVVMSGCSVLAPKANLSQYYVLRSQSEAFNSAVTNSAVSEIRVGPGQIATYLQDGQIAVQDGPNRMVYLENDRWAEPLSKGFSRVLAENLAHNLGAETVSVYPNPPLMDSGYEVRYTVESFEGSLSGPVALIVSWQMVERPSLKVIAGKRSVYTVPAQKDSDSVASYVERMSSALGQWADDIAAAIQSR